MFDSNKFVDKDLICDFLYFCDLNLNNDKLLRPSNENEALSASMQQVLLMFNLYSPWRHDNVIHRQVINLLIDKLSGSLTGIPTLPLRSEAINFCKAFASSNECVAKKWFNQDRLFNDDFSKYPEDLVSDSDLSAKLANVIPSCRDQNELVSQVTKIIIDRQRLTHLA